MLIKCMYYLKLLLISAFLALILASVEISFDNPVLFISIALILTASIRLLWVSVLKDELKMKRQAKIRKSIGVNIQTTETHKAA